MSDKHLPSWVIAVVIALVVLLLGAGGYRMMNRGQEQPGSNPADLAQTQAAERPGDTPSGNKAPVDPNQSAEPTGTAGRGPGR